MKTKIAYLTSPEVGRYVFNFQLTGSEDLWSIEIQPEQMRNILVDGVTHMLRNSLHRVPVIQATESAPHEPDRRQLTT